MIDRNDFELRIATHTDAVARINETDWQRQGSRRTLRATVATALISLANLLAPVQQPTTQPVQAHWEYRLGA